eukprot:TRINITY_DN15956_c0_g1_i1.p1 TRINITY_DN15956_c0_g1~~TRINITY_DN15956_c0_g1_i1.p1  ORF type:complete len:215 (+),score=13.48 TRINITY_DN15956_c0_g1_i1:143-787(+)
MGDEFRLQGISPADPDPSIQTAQTVQIDCDNSKTFEPKKGLTALSITFAALSNRWSGCFSIFTLVATVTISTYLALAVLFGWWRCSYQAGHSIPEVAELRLLFKVAISLLPGFVITLFGWSFAYHLPRVHYRLGKRKDGLHSPCARISVQALRTVFCFIVGIWLLGVLVYIMGSMFTGNDACIHWAEAVVSVFVWAGLWGLIPIPMVAIWCNGK